MLVNAKTRGKNLRITLWLLLASYHFAWLIRNLHIIHYVKKYKNSVDRAVTSKTLCFVSCPTVAGPQTRWIPHTKQSRASWESWQGRIPCCCFLQISRPQQDQRPQAVAPLMENRMKAVWARYHSWFIGKVRCWVFSCRIGKQHGFPLQVLGLRESM